MIQEYGKMPPQAVEIEEAVLGAMMLESHAIINAMAFLSADDFYADQHQKIFSAISELYNNDQKTDILTVTEELRKKEQLDMVGGPFYITQLTSRVASAAHMDFHCAIILQKSIARKLIAETSNCQTRAYDESEDVYDVMEDLQNALIKIRSTEIGGTHTIDDCIQEVFDHMDNISADRLPGIPTGLRDYDKKSNGFTGQGDLIIIAGETSMGKTSLALSLLLRSCVYHGYSAAFFSLEMSRIKLTARLKSMLSGVNSNKILSEKLNENEYRLVEEAAALLHGKNIIIEDKSSSIAKVSSKIRELYVKYGIRRFYIDFLQLVKGEKGAGREQEVGGVVRALKNLANELDGIEIIVLSQLNRNKDNPFPTLSRLRDSGQIEEAADIIMFVWRPEYYNSSGRDMGDMFDGDFSDVPVKGNAQIVVAKGRNIGTFSFITKFESHITLFSDYDKNEAELENYYESNNDMGQNNTF